MDTIVNINLFIRVILRCDMPVCSQYKQLQKDKNYARAHLTLL